MPRLSRLVGITACIGIGACGGSDATTTPPAKVVARVVVAGSTALIVGQNTMLSATAFEASGAQIVSPGAATWSSSAPLIATVDQTGKLTGVGAGTATASADIAGVRGSLAIRINFLDGASKDTIFTIGTNTFSPSPLTVPVGST